MERDSIQGAMAMVWQSRGTPKPAKNYFALAGKIIFSAWIRLRRVPTAHSLQRANLMRTSKFGMPPTVICSVPYSVMRAMLAEWRLALMENIWRVLARMVRHAFGIP